MSDPVTTSEASVVRLDSLGHHKPGRSIWRRRRAWSLELEAWSFEPGTGRADGRNKAQETSGRLLLLLLLCAYFRLSPSLRKWKQRKEPCSPRDLGEDCLGIEGLALARLPVLWPGSRQICLCPNAPIYVVRRFMSRRGTKRTQTRGPVMRLRWFWVADGERGKGGTDAQRRGPHMQRDPHTSPHRRRGVPVGLTQAADNRHANSRASAGSSLDWASCEDDLQRGSLHLYKRPERGLRVLRVLRVLAGSGSNAHDDAG